MSAPIDLEEMILEARRETAKRRQVYPRLVSNGQLNARQASRQIDRMQAIHDLLLDLQKDPTALPHVLRERTLFAA